MDLLLDVVNCEDVSEQILVEFDFMSSVKDLSLNILEGEFLFGKDHGSDKSLPVLEIVLSLGLERLELFWIFLEVKAEKDSRRSVVFCDFIRVSFVLFLHESFMELNFGRKDDPFLFIERLFIVDVLKEVSLQNIFPGGALLSFDVDLT